MRHLSTIGEPTDDDIKETWTRSQLRAILSGSASYGHVMGTSGSAPRKRKPDRVRPQTARRLRAIKLGLEDIVSEEGHAPDWRKTEPQDDVSTIQAIGNS